jgi:hypothetical protein
VSVFIRDVGTGSEIQRGKTDVHGIYDLSGVPPGRYQICWEAAGWVPGCTLHPVTVSSDSDGDHVDVDPVGLAPDGRGVVVGHIRLAGGGGCFYSDPEFGVEQNAMVSAVDGGGNVVGGPVQANSSGKYVLAGLPPEDLRVRAACGNSSVEATVPLAAFTSVRVAQLDLTLSGAPVRFVALRAQLDAEPVKSVPPGAAVDLEVETEGGNAGQLQFRWATTPGFGSIASTGGNHAQWSAPLEPGDGQIHVLISNARGFFDRGGIVMSVGSREVGLVVSPDPPYAKDAVAAGVSQKGKADKIPPYTGYPNSGPFLTLRNNRGNGTFAQNYYQTVVAPSYITGACGTGKRCTLGGWLTENGWKDNGEPDPARIEEARTVFLNNNDLGYVRDMHCMSRKIDVTIESVQACWVTNYSLPADQEVDSSNPANFDLPLVPDFVKLGNDFENAILMSTPGPAAAQTTVTMEYRGHLRNHDGTLANGGNPVVTFIAYNPPPDGNLANSPISENSDQDGFGGKPVPGMCNNCHGGRSYDGNATDTGGKFIVFDLSTFIFPTDGGWTRNDQEIAFMKQNMVVKAAGAPPAIVELINGWYQNFGTTGKANDAFVPTAWMNQPNTNLPFPSQKLYLNVVRTCRTCHTALRNAVSWRTYGQFVTNVSGIQTRVCAGNAGRDTMPHAAISYLNFWRTLPPQGSPQNMPAYQMGGPTPTVTMLQPFLDMGAFMLAQRESAGLCMNPK